MSESEKRITDTMTKHNLTVSSVFVPWSQSRNKGEKQPSLNWRVTLARNGHAILTTDYSAGMGYCPAYKVRKITPQRVDRDTLDVITRECETGKAHRMLPASGSVMAYIPLRFIEPDPCDVIASLVMDSDVLDYPTFEEWGLAFGYDPDSRKGEVIYRACLTIALQMRAGLGEAVLDELREACRDY